MSRRPRLRLTARRHLSAGGYLRVLYTCPCDGLQRAYGVARQHLLHAHACSGRLAESKLRQAATALPPTLETAKRCTQCQTLQRDHAACACCGAYLHPAPVRVPALCAWCRHHMQHRAEVQHVLAEEQSCPQSA